MGIPERGLRALRASYGHALRGWPRLIGGVWCSNPAFPPKPSVANGDKGKGGTIGGIEFTVILCGPKRPEQSDVTERPK